MKLVVNGGKELQEALKAYQGYASDAVSNAIKTTALAVEADAVKNIQRGTKSGKVYKRGSVEHQASAPGESPASDTGNLASSIKAVIRPNIAIVGTDQDYGAYLEFGTVNISERPWLRPAKQKNIDLYLTLMAKGLASFKP